MNKTIWFAGFYEGEGSISNDISNRNKLRVSISQNDPTPLKIGQEIWGGKVRTRTRISITGKECHGNEWILSHHDSIRFINDIKPYMLIPYKIKQIEDAFIKMNEEWDRSFKCSFCDSVFADMSGRRRHEKNQHIHKDQEFICECGNKYTAKDSLNRHKKSCVSEEAN